MATFFERAGAYLIDLFIVGLLFSIVGVGIPQNTSDTDALMKELEDKLLNNEITTQEYFQEYSDLIYDMQNSSKLSFGISLALNIAYFVVFQTLFNGQTIGKRILKIKVVDKDSRKDAGIVKIFVRSLFTLSIFSGSMNLILLFVLSKTKYTVFYAVISALELIFTLTTIILILYKKDKRGLHDMMAGTLVIKEG